MKEWLPVEGLIFLDSNTTFPQGYEGKGYKYKGSYESGYHNNGDDYYYAADDGHQQQHQCNNKIPKPTDYRDTRRKGNPEKRQQDNVIVDAIHNTVPLRRRLHPYTRKSSALNGPIAFVEQVKRH